MRRASFAEGEYIVRQGETSPIFCLVQEGTVSVLKQAEGEQEVEGPPYPSPLTRPSEPLATTALAPRAGGGGPARGGPVLRRGGPQGRRAALGQLQGLRRASQAAHDHAAEDGGATSARSRPPPPPGPGPGPVDLRPTSRQDLLGELVELLSAEFSQKVLLLAPWLQGIEVDARRRVAARFTQARALRRPAPIAAASSPLISPCDPRSASSTTARPSSPTARRATRCTSC